MKTNFESPTLLPFQLKPTDILSDCLSRGLDARQRGKAGKGQLIIGPTGSGKTFVMAFGIKKLQDSGKLIRSDDDFFKLHTVFVLVPKNSIIQTQRVFSKVGLKDTLVTNGDSLRTKGGGELYIDWISQFDHGHLVQKPVWKADTMPDVIIADECQMFKSPRSQRTKILRAFVEQGGILILVSATPFQKACEAQLIVEACRFLGEHNSFDWYANQVSNSNPSGNSPIAIKRIKNDLENNGCLNMITGVKYPFKPTIENMMLTPEPWEAKAVEQAYEEYREIRRKIMKKPDHQGIIELWQAQRVMRLKCELIRVPKICKFAKARQEVDGKAILMASNFIPTLNKYWSYFVRELNIDPNKISCLFGGFSEKKRQEQIDAFQLGKTQYFLTTLKSGGTSLSLNHQFPNALPRQVLLQPTWSIYELMQVLGRAQRVDNLSPVHQYLVWYSDTVEAKVARRLGEKYNCIKELLDRKDDYISNLFNEELGDSNSELDAKIRQLDDIQNLKDSDELDEEDDGELDEESEKSHISSLFDTMEL